MAISLSQKAQKIVRIYGVVYNVIFVCGLPVLACIISIVLIFLMQGNVSAEREATRTDEIRLTEKRYVQDFFGFMDEGENIEGLDIVIKKGPLTLQSGLVQSVDNFITFKGLVFPKEVSIFQTVPLKEKSYFESTSYSLIELERYLDNTIFTTQEIEYIAEPRPKISLNDLGVTDYFNISCVTANKVFDTICNQFVEDFLETFFVYDLSVDYNGLMQVYEGIKSNATYAQKFCDGVTRYMKYSDDTESSLGVIASLCGEEYHADYDEYSSFVNIQGDLTGPASSQFAFNNHNINAYKLLSIQQKIYHELINKRFNQARIDYYLKFVEELLRKDTIDPFYKDIIYIFNNDHLQKQILSAQISSIIADKDTIKKIADDIRKVNKGNELIGYKGLQEQIHGTELQARIKSTEEEIPVLGPNDKKDTDTLLDRFDARFSFPSLTIFEKSLTGSDETLVYIQGKMAIRGSDKKQQRYDIEVYFEEYAGSFVVKQIFFKESENLSKVLNNISKDNKLSMAKMYEYIGENVSLFENAQSDITLCDKIQAEIVGIQECSETQILLETEYNGSGYIYTLTHNKGSIENVAIRSKDTNKQIGDQFDITKTNEETIIAYIQAMIEYQPEKAKDVRFMDLDETKESDRIQIASDFAKYLGDEPESVMTKSGVTLVIFSIDKQDLIAQYDFATNTIQTLFFRELGTRFPFLDLNLVLSEENIQDVDFFREELFLFLDEKNPDIVDLYLEKTDQTREDEEE